MEEASDQLRRRVLRMAEIEALFAAARDGGGGGCRDGVICGEDSATTIVLKERMRGVRIRAMILLVAKGAGRELVFAIVLGYDDGETVVGEEGVGGPVDMVGVIVEGVRLKGRTPPLGLV